MAYIPEEEENKQEVGMDVLAEGQQAPQQQMQPTQQPEQQLTSGESGTIGANQPQQAPQQQSQGRQPKGSGMFTDIRKYIKAGQPGVQRMGQAVSGGIQKQTTGLGQQLAKQQQQFGQQVTGQQQRLAGAQQFAQDVTQRAASQQNIPYLQQQQEARKKALESLGPLKQGGYQSDIEPLQGSTQQLSQLQAQAGQFGQSATEAQKNAQKMMWDAISHGGASANYQQELTGRQRAWEENQAKTLQAYQQNPEQIKALLSNIAQGTPTDEANMAVMMGQIGGGQQEAQAALQQIAALEAQKQQQALNPDIQKFQEQSKKLQEFRDLQSKYEESQGLQQELADLTQKIQTAPESLTPEEIQRFQNLTSGETRFDQIGMLDTGMAQSRARALENLVRGAERPTGRGELLRETLGKGRDYTRGQRGLDELLLSSRPDVQRQTLDTAREATTGFKSDVTEARKRALEDMYGLRKGTFDLVGQEGSALQNIVGEQGELTDLRSQLDQAIAAEQERLATRREDLLGKFGKKQFLTAEDFADLGISEKDRGIMQALATARGADYNLADYLNVFDPNAVTRQGVATPEQLAQQRALASLAGEQQFGEQTKPTLDFNMAGLIADAARQTPGISYDPSVGITGDKAALEKFSQRLTAINPLLGSSLMAINQVAGQPVMQGLEAVGGVTGQDFEGALNEASTGLGAATDLAKAGVTLPYQLMVDPFSLDKAQGILSSAGQVVLSPAQIAARLAPRVTGNAAVDALLTGGLSEVGRVANVAENAYQSTLGKLFCFAKDAMIHLIDGTKKAVQDLELGDILLEGGEVFGRGEVICPDIYEYKGLRVSGSHAVLENGKWIRVRDSKLGKELNETDKVYPITCENHIMITDNFVSSDFQETEPEVGYNEDDRLAALNSKTELNEYLSRHYEGIKKVA